MMSQSYTPPKLVPPFRFATVEVGVYRGAYPTLKVQKADALRGRGVALALNPAQRQLGHPADGAAACAAELSFSGDAQDPHHHLPNPRETHTGLGFMVYGLWFRGLGFRV